MAEKKDFFKENIHSIEVSQNWLPNDYEKVVDESILKINLTPDIFQKQAFYMLKKHESIFVSAHTSAGKTLVAEYAISLTEIDNSRTIYTSPIKALSNQKFYDFKQKFTDVGIITGDSQVNPTGKCLIMTTEILRNFIYKNNDILHNTKYIIFDEVHYINDQERGVVWEECIIMLPKHITLILLSATIPNSKEFSDWVGRTTSRCVYIISTNKRPVPLEHLIYADREAYAIKETPKDLGKNEPSNIKTRLIHISKKSTPAGRFKVIDLANFVIRKKLIPVIFFCFSKRRCESIIDELSSLDITTVPEKKQIKEFLRKAIEQLPVEERNLPQIVKLMKFANIGIMVHHGGLLPFVKECIEILFSLNLIKILVATETFAMGVNMPAKCVAFLTLSKIDGESFRYLTTGEYTQMSGRAGRRGMDKVGTVLIADEKMVPVHIIKRIINGNPTSLNSQFRLSFGLILIAIRSNIPVEELMRKSYKEHSKQKSEARDMFRMKNLEEIKMVDCEDIMVYLELLEIIYNHNNKILTKYKLIKEGDIILSLENELYRIVKINDNILSVAPYADESTIDDLVKNFTILNTEENTTLKYPHTIHKIGNKKTIKRSEIFCILRDGVPNFDYNIKEVEDFLSINKIKQWFNKLTQCKCIECPNFTEHYLKAVIYKKAQEEISRINVRYSITNLDLIEEYNNRIKFLIKNNFYDTFVTLKGRVAAEIRTVNEVLSTEMIFDNEFKNLKPEIIISLFSSMICEEGLEEVKYDDVLREGIYKMSEHYNKLSKDLEDLFIPPFKPLDFSLAQAVYDWCNKSTLNTIVTRYDVSEGVFVRLILRLDECCREMINACILIEDNELEGKFREASQLLKRDIVFLPSLYL